MVVALPPVAPSRGGGDDGLDVTYVGGVEHPGRPAEDVDREVMAAHQPVVAQACDLFSGMAFDVIGECHFPPSPRFTLDLDRGDLFSDEPGPGVQERQTQVGPQRLPGEIGEMNVVPWCL